MGNRSTWVGCLGEVLLLRLHEMRLSLLPTGAALKGVGEQMIDQSRHRDLPVTGLMVEDANNRSRDARHVVTWSWHDGT